MRCCFFPLECPHPPLDPHCCLHEGKNNGGLKCLDVDTNKVVVTSREEMHFNKGWKSRGWCVWTTDSDGNEETIELVTFIEMIQLNTVTQLEEYGIILVQKDKEEEEDSDHSDEE